MSTARTVVLVGHCGPDLFMLRSAIGRVLDGIPIEAANDDGTLAAHRHAGALLVVARALDGDFPDADGIALIERVTGGEGPRAILVSNYDEAQARAVAAGAHPGFGKTALYDEETAGRLRAAAGV